MALVVPLTTRGRGLDHHICISSAASGLPQPSWARTEEITAVSTVRFTHAAPMGPASPKEVRELSDWLCEMVAFA
jgi:mRNA interferase MazF